MALFVVRHQHAADRCPSQNPYVGTELLIHLSRPSAKKHGVRIQGEAVIQNEHTSYLIVEAADESGLRAFLRPFQMAGSLEIYAASTFAHVVTSGGCTSSIPASELAAALDPERACRQAIDAGLVVHRAHPLNCETSLPALVGGVVMPNARFYVRNHFQIPLLEEAAFRLNVSGLVERPMALTVRDLHNMRSHTLVATLECAGNGRTLFDRPTPGEKWTLGAVSTAEWTGVPLVEVLDRAGVRADARDVVFRGADSGHVDDHDGSIRFERSLQIDRARDPNVLLAYAMNGERLPVLHGQPVRLIVPGWYAVASVKWLTEIDVTNQAFTGYYQHDKYWYEYSRDGQVVRQPVTIQRVRALVTEPEPNVEIRRGEVAIRGVAWSGAAPIARVDVSVNGGDWRQAQFVGDRSRHSWLWWELIVRLDTTGVATIRARAADMADRIQPEQAEWNRLGYGNNGVQTVPIRVI
jgi:DMSO/TMAO reductase YedYZ molybdopterin-dependent catalytic subunit